MSARARIIILGAGWYGCHLSTALKAEHDVLVLEKAHDIFTGASGANPARLHIGPHYPRSATTRAACQRHTSIFMQEYGNLTRPVKQNIYAVAAVDSLVDYRTYVQILRGEIPLMEIYDPAEVGLLNVEGAIAVRERHIVIEKVRQHFREVAGPIWFNTTPDDAEVECGSADLVIDCTFCAESSTGVDRYEPCMTVLMEGPTDTAITVMDGPFPSLYPWDEALNISSLTSARFTPIARCDSYQTAVKELQAFKDDQSAREKRADLMIDQMSGFFPSVRDTHRNVGYLFGIRAMPASRSDARMVNVVEKRPGWLQIRAGKIDAIFDAEHQVREYLRSLQ